MAQYYANVSLLTSGATDPGGARNFSYLRVLNTDILTGGGGGTTITSVISSIVTSILSGSVTNYYFSNSNNVSFGTAGTRVTASASFSQTEVARADWWMKGGVYVATASPSNPCQYSDWESGSSGYFGWLQIP